MTEGEIQQQANQAVAEATSQPVQAPTVLEVLQAFIVGMAQLSGRVHRPVLEVTLDQDVWLQAFYVLCDRTKRDVPVPSALPQWFEVGSGSLVVRVKRPSTVDPEITTQQGYERLRRALAEDEGFRQGWRDNVAVMLMDEQGEGAPLDMSDKDQRDLAAARVLDHLFPVKRPL